MEVFGEVLKNLQFFQLYPGSALVAFLVGCFIGLFAMRMRYQGRIDTLNERINHKDDVIVFKDKVIQDLSEKIKVVTDREEPAAKTKNKVTLPEPRLEHEYPATRGRVAKPDQKREAKPDQKREVRPDRFQAINSQITSDSERQILNALSNIAFRFVFNPATGASKTITFLPDGTIGQGRNPNENTWRVRNGRLEILNSRGELYSRFILLKGHRSFHHTNDPDTQSIRGQYLEAL